MLSAENPLAAVRAERSPTKLYERCWKGNKTCWKGKFSYPSNIAQISKSLTHNTLQKQDMFKGRKNLPFQHKTRPFEHKITSRSYIAAP
jgi:hypothetical protein